MISMVKIFLKGQIALMMVFILNLTRMSISRGLMG